MPETLLLASKALFAAAGLGAGVRLAQIARRDGGLPLHAWGSAMVLAGGLGLLGFALGPALAKEAPAAARALMMASDGLCRLVVLALSLFIWRVFGATSRARTLLLVGVVLLVAANWLRALGRTSWPDPTPPMVRLENQIVLALPFVWSAIETRLAFARSRRQLALGLVDPITSNRFLLWSAACACFASIGFAAAADAVVPAASPPGVALRLAQALLYAAISGIVALAFFPPAAYLRWLSRAAAGVAVAAVLLLPAGARAELSDQERIEKAARRQAVDAATVFTPGFKPRAVCVCNGVFPHPIGFLVYSGPNVSCAVPTQLDVDGNFFVVDFGCLDFVILPR